MKQQNTNCILHKYVCYPRFDNTKDIEIEHTEFECKETDKQYRIIRPRGIRRAIIPKRDVGKPRNIGIHSCIGIWLPHRDDDLVKKLCAEVWKKWAEYEYKEYKIAKQQMDDLQKNTKVRIIEYTSEI